MARANKVIWVRLPVDEFDRRLKEQFKQGFIQGAIYKSDQKPKETVDSAELEMVAMVTQLGHANAQFTVSVAKMLELCKR